MKLLRIKIIDPAGFRSLPCGFEHYFRDEWTLQDEPLNTDSFAPFVCAGPNGCGKSNLLEVLAAIFFQLEVQRVRRSFLPEALQKNTFNFSPAAFELEYLIRIPKDYIKTNGAEWASVKVIKKLGQSVVTSWENQIEFDVNTMEFVTGEVLNILLPEYVLGYSSGENEILSLPFFKMRFVQFDEYWRSLQAQLPYPGRPETRLTFLDNSYSQVVLLCNLLFQDNETLRPFREEVGIEELKEFRIIIKRKIEIDAAQFDSFGMAEEKTVEGILSKNRALSISDDDIEGVRRYYLNLVHGLEKDQDSNENIDPILERLKRCATISYVDEPSDTITLDYWVNEETKRAFRENFDDSPLALFQAFQVLLTLNLYSVSDALKFDLYQSASQYVSETVPILASDKRTMRFKNFYFNKRCVEKPMLLKELSDGEHQLLHSLGLCLLFRNTNSLILLDEPETHFNPSWRASFISQLKACLGNTKKTPEMLITTHSPFLISDSKPNKVLEFEKDPETRHVKITHPEYNTFGASINKITMKTFNKRETIGGNAQLLMDSLRARFEQGEEPTALIDELNRELGDSVEKILLINAMLEGTQESGGEVQG